MKKMYLKPETTWMNVEVQQMVCDSLDASGTTSNEADLLTREIDDWDE